MEPASHALLCLGSASGPCADLTWSAGWEALFGNCRQLGVGLFQVGKWKRLHLKSHLCGADLTFRYLKHERITVLSGSPLRLLQGRFGIHNSLWAHLKLVRVIWLTLVRFECSMLIKTAISRGSNASLMLFTPAFTAGNYVQNFYSVIFLCASALAWFLAL